jgi:hypothetical protein
MPEMKRGTREKLEKSMYKYNVCVYIYICLEWSSQGGWDGQGM